MASAINEIGSQIIQKAFSGILWFGVAFVLISVVGFIFWWFYVYQRKFNIKVKVISERANDKNVIIFDKAAILRDKKDGSSYFRLWGLKLELPSPSFNVLQTEGNRDYLELYRTSQNSIYFLTPTKIDKTKVYQHDGKTILLASQRSNRVNPDMEFWQIKRKNLNNKMFDTEKLWMKLLPFIPQIIGGVLVIFTLYILMTHLPSILSELTTLTQEMRSLKGASVVKTLLPLI